MRRCTLGLDFGTNSVRALVVDAADGNELGTAVAAYPGGTDGVLLDPADHTLARQAPGDYTVCLARAVRAALRQAHRQTGVTGAAVAGVGVDSTGSTPIPVDARNRPLAAQARWAHDLDAQAWLWKDHTAHAEAARITDAARRLRPHYLARCGGVYSSEWYWSKLWHCLNAAPQVFEAAAAWIELQDYIPAVLCGVARPEAVVRGVCAAGHKALFHAGWGGWPDAEFLAALDPRLARVRQTLPPDTHTIREAAGRLDPAWARTLGLTPGIPVAVGAVDAHLGAVGAGIRTATLVKIIGTSSCDILVVPPAHPAPEIPGVCGMVEGSVLPGRTAIEAGQSAVGDIFRWFVSRVCQGRDTLHRTLASEARTLRPGASGLLGLDWQNGNRTVLADPNLTGLLLGMTLHTTRAELYRALIEATAFGALTIIRRIEEYGVPIERVVCCGGIAEKNPLLLQIYADVLDRPIRVSRARQTCALGAAIAGALAAGLHPDAETAIGAMTGVRPESYQPDSAAVPVYRDLFRLYARLHDAFGTARAPESLQGVMKDLLAIQQAASRTP